MMKSKMFHPLRRYVPSPITKPYEKTLTSSSAVKIKLHKSSNVDRASSGHGSRGHESRLESSGSSIAIITALPTMTNMMNPSNHGDVHVCRAISRAGLSWPKRKSDRVFFMLLLPLLPLPHRGENDVPRTFLFQGMAAAGPGQAPPRLGTGNRGQRAITRATRPVDRAGPPVGPPGALWGGALVAPSTPRHSRKEMCWPLLDLLCLPC